MSGEFIFVYGTLRKEFSSSMSSILQRCCNYLSPGQMQGKMYEVGEYPGAVESDNPEDIVHGDIYSIIDPEIVLPVLDEYEECSEKFSRPHEYVRKMKMISTPGGESISAWVYIYNHDVTGFPRIRSGDYING